MNLEDVLITAINLDLPVAPKIDKATLELIPSVKRIRKLGALSRLCYAAESETGKTFINNLSPILIRNVKRCRSFLLTVLP